MLPPLATAVCSLTALTETPTITSSIFITGRHRAAPKEIHLNGEMEVPRKIPRNTV